MTWGALYGFRSAIGQLEVLSVIPWQSAVQLRKEVGAVFLERRQVFKLIDLAKEAGVDETHELIADVRTMLCFVKQRVFPIRDSYLVRSLADLIVDRTSQCEERASTLANG